MSSEQVAATAETEGPSAGEATGRRRTLRNLGIVVVAVIALDILALLFAPPFPRGGQPGDACAFPVCFINGTLEFPAPHVVLDLDPGNPMPEGQAVVTFHPSITSTIVTMWIVMAILIVLAFVATRGMRLVPRGAPERCRVRLRVARELRRRARRRRRAALHPAVRRVLPPHPVLQLERAHPAHRQDRGAAGARPSDVNITIGLALVALRLLRVPGLPAPRRRRLPRQVLPVLRVPEGHRRRAHRPVRRPDRAHARVRQAGHAVDATLRQHLRRRGRPGRRSRALILRHPPVAMLGLEVMLNFVQALIFSVLTLMFTLLAIESSRARGGRSSVDEGLEALEGRSRSRRPSPAH